MKEGVCLHFSDNLFFVAVGHAFKVQFLPGKYLRLCEVRPVTERKGGVNLFQLTTPSDLRLTFRIMPKDPLPMTSSDS